VPTNHKPGAQRDCFKAVPENGRRERNSPELAGSGALGELALVLRGGVADYGFEVVDEMGLVEVAEVQGELRPMGLGAGVELFYQFVEAITADDPFGAGADVVVEEALEGTLADPCTGGQIVYGFDVGFGEDAGH